MKGVALAGQSRKIEQLMRSVQAGRIVHALLFVGPTGTGKRTAANWFAQAVLCSEADAPCGSCPACKQYVNGTHPDVRIVRPEKNVIKVDAIRDLIEYLALHPYAGGKHIAIIEQADKMNASAQNALLKTLESPVGNVMFFLLTDTPGSLLSTIQSRCQMVRFQVPDVETCAVILAQRGIASQRAAMLAGVAQGSVGHALELDGDSEFFELRARTIEALEALRGSATVARAAAGIANEKGRERTILEIMELWARDRMMLQNGGQPFQQDELARLQKSRLDGTALLKAVICARKALDANIAWINVLENMFFELSKE